MYKKVVSIALVVLLMVSIIPFQFFTVTASEIIETILSPQGAYVLSTGDDDTEIADDNAILDETFSVDEGSVPGENPSDDDTNFSDDSSHADDETSGETPDDELIYDEDYYFEEAYITDEFDSISPMWAPSSRTVMFHANRVAPPFDLSNRRIFLEGPYPMPPLAYPNTTSVARFHNVQMGWGHTFDQMIQDFGIVPMRPELTTYLRDGLLRPSEGSGVFSDNDYHWLVGQRTVDFEIFGGWYDSLDSADALWSSEGRITRETEVPHGFEPLYVFARWYPTREVTFVFGPYHTPGNYVVANRLVVMVDTDPGSIIGANQTNFSQVLDWDNGVLNGVCVLRENGDEPIIMPEREGYTFVGWETADGLHVTDNTSIYEVAWPDPIETPLRLYPRWEALPVYTLQINVVDQDGNQIPDAHVEFDGMYVSFDGSFWNLTFPAPTSGYITASANDFIPGSASVFDFDFCPATRIAEIVIELEWPEPDMYEVRFVLNGGSVNDSTDDIIHEFIPHDMIGHHLYHIYEPVRHGYIFDGWRYDDQADHIPNLNHIDVLHHTVVEPITFIAQWVPVIPEFPVTFNLNGGEVHGSTASIVHGIYQYDMVGIENVPEPVRFNYIFVGWSLDNHTLLTNDEVANHIVVEPVTFYAMWIPHTYSVTFDLNGGNVGGSTVDVILEFYRYTAIDMANVPAPVHPDYIFAGWRYHGQAALSPSLTDEDVANHIVTEPIMFIAQWVPIIHEVTFDLDGGLVNGLPADIVHEIIQYNIVSAPNVPAPLRDDYDFTGWRYDGQATGTPNLTSDDVANHIVTETITFIAQWTPAIPSIYTFTVTFDLNGGHVNGSTANIAHDIPQYNTVGPANVPAPSLDDYTFAGWRYSGQTAGTPNLTDAEVANHIVLETITFTAQWTPVVDIMSTVTVTFNLNGGHVNGSTANIIHEVYPYGDIGLTNVPTPVRADHHFNGWRYNGQVTGTPNLTLQQVANHIVTRSIIFTAQWTPQTGGGTPGVGTPGDSIPGGSAPGNGIPGTNGGPRVSGSGSTGRVPGGHISLAPGHVDDTPPLLDVMEVILAELAENPFIAEHIAYISGYPDGSVGPDQPVTRAEIAMMLFRLINSEFKHLPQDTRFSDVDATKWYAQAVNYLASRSILSGYPDGTFRPNNHITRAELATVMSKFFDLDTSGTSHFTDVDSTHWAFIFINNAHNRGWISGYGDGTFRPDNATSRAEAVTLINRVLERIPNPESIDYQLGGILVFSDITPAHWAFYQIMEAALEHEFDIDINGLESWTQILSFPAHLTHLQP